MKCTKRDMNLLTCLRENARYTLTEISKKTKIPISTLYDRLKAQQGNTITKHVTLIDFDALGYSARIHMLVRVPPTKREELRGFLQIHEHVNALFEVASEYDFALEGIFSQVKDVQSFIRQLEKQFPELQYHNQFITKDLKRETFLAGAS